MSARPALGLYLSDQYIEISQLSADGMRLVRFNQLSLPAGLVVNGEIKNAVGLAGVLFQLLKTARPKPISLGEDVVIGVGDNRVFLREISLPKFPGKDIEEAIDWQVRTLLPVLPAGVETDWQIIGRTADDQIEVLLSAIPKDVISSYIEIASSVGLRVVAIEPAVFANVRIIKPEMFTGKNQLLVYLGDVFSEFSYITNGVPRFSDFLALSEITKKGTLVEVIADYVNFANSKHPGRPVDEIIVSGFSSQTAAVVEALKAQKYRAVLAVSRLESAQVKDHSLVHTAHGLSLKTFDSAASTNLLPMDYRLDVVSRRYYSLWKQILVLLIFMTIFVGGGLYYLYRQALVRTAQLTALRAVYQQQLDRPANKQLIQQAQNLNSLTDKLVILRQATGGEYVLLRQLSASVPTGIVLTSFVYSRGASARNLTDLNSSWSLTGTASSRDMVLSFYNQLVGIANFSNGRLYFGSLEKETAVNFRIASQQAL